MAVAGRGGGRLVFEDMKSLPQRIQRGFGGWEENNDREIWCLEQNMNVNASLIFDVCSGGKD